MQALRALARHDDARWARAFWFGHDFKALVAKMDAQERAEVLASLSSLQELNYQTEEILREVGEKDLDAVLRFLAERLKTETKDRVQRRAQGRSNLDGKFEAIPYHVHGLNKLLEQQPQKIVSLLRHSFDDDEARAMFPYRGGARLVKAVFPGFEPQLQTVLLKLLESGDQRDIEFVSAIVRSYGSAAPILDVCEAIVKAVPEHSSTWRELAAAIDTMGGVWGEYGLVTAFERKRDEIAPWRASENERVRAFADWLTERLERRIVDERQRVDEDLALRKYRYGVGDNEG